MQGRYLKIKLQNVAADWLNLLLRILEAPVQILDPKTGFSKVSEKFISPFWHIPGEYIELDHGSLIASPFQFTVQESFDFILYVRLISLHIYHE